MDRPVSGAPRPDGRLGFDPEPVGDPTDVVEVRDDLHGIVQRAVAQAVRPEGIQIIRADGVDVEAESVGDCAGLVLGADQQVLIGRQGPDSPWQSIGFYVIE